MTSYVNDKETMRDLETELGELEAEIERQRLTRERAIYRLEQALRERARLDRHLALLKREEGA
jgi:hypothetical protein